MLRLTKRSEYGLMALAFIAQSGPAYTSVRSIVADLGVPRRLLAEVLKDLSRAELVEAIRGPGGGYRLTGPPEKLSLARVVEILEGPVKVAECADGGHCNLSPSCTIQSGINVVADRIKSVLDTYSLAELAGASDAATATAAAPATPAAATIPTAALRKDPFTV